MGYIRQFRRLLRGTVDRVDEDEKFACLKCGEKFDRHYQSCPSCGGAFIAPRDES